MVSRSTQENQKVSAAQVFYATHSTASNPGKYAQLFDDLPNDLPGISRITQGLVYHYIGDQYRFGYVPPKERMGEIDSRLMERMLGRLVEMDSRPLTETRAYENRLVGCCRDFSLIACAILRHQGTPARLRYGFGNYFIPDYWMDHVIVEVWNGSGWQRFDPEFATETDKLNVPETEFATGGRAWDMIRREGADPSQFGIGPGIPDVSGEWFVRARLLLDIAALNKQEMLCWDQWASGYPMETPLSAEDEAFLDQAAALSQQAESEELREQYATDDRLRVPEAVLCFSPAIGPHEVMVG